MGSLSSSAKGFFDSSYVSKGFLPSMIAEDIFCGGFVREVFGDCWGDLWTKGSSLLILASRLELY